MKKYIKIQSSVNIQVTAGLDALNMTDANQPIADKLKVQALWTKEKVLIKTGAGYYPGIISTWKTVKALAKDNVITLGEFVDELPSTMTEEEYANTVRIEENLKNGVAEKERQIKSQTVIKETKAEKKAKQLSELALDKTEE